MQTYAEVLTYAIPFFMVLILIEYYFSVRMGRVVVRSFDTVSSLSSGMTNSIKEVLELAVVIISYGWLESRLGLFRIESTILVYVLTFIGLDFAGYWAHRFEHEVNLLWNRHVIHHSSEEFNLACALRQNISAVFGIFFFLYIPLAILGIPGEVIAVVAPLHLFAQFWYHTRLIDRMGWLEHIIVTPSHHRVHHAINDAYMDKNFSQVFIVWDKVFGTFQPELENEQAIYGVRRQANTWNPFLINFQHLALLTMDAWRTKSWIDKLRVFYMPTGWRPADVMVSHPVAYTEIAADQIKYTTTASRYLHIWIWSQLLMTMILMLHFFSQLGAGSAISIMLYATFLCLSIFSYTSLMDGAGVRLMISEAVRLMIVAAVLWLHGGWFADARSVDDISIVIVIMIIGSVVVNLWFWHREGQWIRTNSSSHGATASTIGM